jgi:hydroxyacylglutathione hydrolase
MAGLEIHQFLAGADNYCVLLHDADAGITISIDAPDAATIEAQLAIKGWRLTHILITHHHGDHTAGNLALKASTGCGIVGPAAEADKIPGIGRTVRGGDHVQLGRLDFAVIETPGHTLGHIAYHDANAHLAFVGDTLFTLGCGRVIEGDYPMMWASLSKLAALPPETRVYCGHEYTAANARFALTIEPGNAALQARAKQAALGGPMVPTRISDELATNPFLRADSAAIRSHLGLDGVPASAVFAQIRDRKNKS